MQDLRSPSCERFELSDHVGAADSSAFQEAMSRVVSSVHIVTTNGSSGLAGITASAVSSVSAEPPIMLFCINRSSSSVERFLANRCFCVNTLAPCDQGLSDVFAGRTSERLDRRFATGAWKRAATGAPVLATALAAFDCRLIEAREVLTHFIMLGMVEAIEISSEPRALLYTRRRYAEI